MSTAPPEQPPVRIRWIAPVASFSLMFIALGLPYWWQAMDFDLRPVGYMQLVGVILSFILVGFLIVWFFGVTRVSRPTKWKVLALAALFLAGFYACVDEVVFNSNVVPIFRFRWQQSPEKALKDYLEEETQDP